MKLFEKNLEEEIVVIAEIGVNHAGSLDWILEILPRLKLAGASAVKFQLFTPDLYSSRSNMARHEYLKSVYISEHAFLKIVDFANELEIPVFATPLSHDWVSFVAEVCGVVKIASGDFTFEPTIRAALKSNAMVIASTGAASKEEVLNFVSIANSLRENVVKSVSLLHCIAAYPPPLSQGNLLAIPTLKEISNLTVGFSSHFLEDAPIYSALALGARIFEIHVTDNRKRKDIRDHALSRTPEELQEIIKTLDGLAQSLVAIEKELQPAEFEIQNAIRKGIIYSRDLLAGDILSPNELNYARPLNPDVPNFESVLGKRLTRSVSAFHSVSPDDFT